ncbi:MAG TPA: hypothetical protein VKQ06_07310 [Gammaproteobacteria bacterium]|nr:hypothetical protein [Gammaproteobacteria bacterium]
MKKLTLPLLLAGLSGLAACEDQGPLEQAGEEIDEAVEDIQTEGEDPVNQIDDAIDEVRDAAEDAVE